VAGAAWEGGLPPLTDGAAADATFSNFTGMAMSLGGTHAYVLDDGYHTVRDVNLVTSQVRTLATFTEPLNDIAVGGDNSLYVTVGRTKPTYADRQANPDQDTGPDKVVKVDRLSGAVSTVATGFYSPGAITFDHSGQMYVLDDVWVLYCCTDIGQLHARASVVAGGSFNVVKVFHPSDAEDASMTFAGGYAYITGIGRYSSCPGCPAMILKWTPGPTDPVDFITGGGPITADRAGTYLYTVSSSMYQIEIASQTVARVVSIRSDEYVDDYPFNEGRGLGLAPDGTLLTSVSGTSYPRVRKVEVHESNWLHTPIHELLGDVVTQEQLEDPVSTGIQNFHETRQDLSFPVWGLSHSRTYNARSDYVGPFGAGWASAFDMSVWAQIKPSTPPTTASTSDVRFHDATGRWLTFTNTGTDNEWSSPRDLFGTLSYTNGAYQIDMANGDRLKFDTAGRLASLSNNVGDEVAVTRDGTGNLLSASHTRNGQLSGYSFTFDDTNADGLIDRLSAADGRTVDFSYDTTTKFLKKSSSPYLPGDVTAGYGERLYYPAPAGQIAEVRSKKSTEPDENAAIVQVTLTYDSAGRVSTLTTKDGDTATFSFDEATGEATTQFATSGDVVKHRYDHEGRAIGLTDPLTKTSDRQWFSFDRASEFRDRSQVSSGTYVDPLGRVRQTAQADPITGFFPTTTTTGCVRNSAGKFPDPSGCGTGEQFLLVTISYVDDSAHANPETENLEARVETVTNPAGEVTRYQYDPGVLVPKAVTVGDGTSDAITTNYEIQDNRVASVTDADGVRSCYDYDATTGRLLSTRALLAAGETCQAATNVATTSYTYTTLGQVETVRAPAQQPGGPVTTHAYYGTGQLKSVTDPLGNVTSYEYDPEGHRSKTILPGGAYTTNTITYNNTADCGTAGTGCTIETTSEPYLGAVRRETKQIFDESGDLREARVAAGTAEEAITRYAYGPLGRLFSVEDPTGVKTFYGYDDNGRVTKTVVGASLVDPAGAVTDTEYDKLGRVVKVTKPSVSNGSSVRPVTAYHYDKAGRQVQVVEGDPNSGWIPPPSTDPGSCKRDPDGKFPVPWVNWGGKDCTNRDFTLRETTYKPNGLVAKQSLRRHDTGHLAGAEAWKVHTYSPGGRMTCTQTRVQDPIVWGMANQYVYDAIDYNAAGRAETTRHQIAALTSAGCADSPDSTAKWAFNATGYNPDGSVQWSQNPLQYEHMLNNPTDNPEHYRTSFTYRDDGKRFQTIVPNPNLAERSTDPTVRSTTCYTARGEVKATVDTGNFVTGYTYYDAPGQVRSVTDPRGLAPVATQETDPCPAIVPDPAARTGTVAYVYDLRGNRTSRTSYDGPANAIVLTEDFQWDLANRQTGRGAPTQAAGDYDTTIAYGILNGRVQSKTTRIGVQGATNVSEIVDSYAPSGAVVSSAATDANGTKTTTNTYDFLGRLKATNTGSGDLILSYNSAGNITQIKYPNRTTEANFYWTLDGHRGGMKTTLPWSFRSRYDEGLREVGFDLAWGVWVPYADNTLNANGQVTKQTLYSNPNGERRTFYDDATGLPTEFRQSVNGATTRWTMTYDRTGRLAGDCKATSTDGNQTDPRPVCQSGDVQRSYSYDAAGQLVGADTANQTAANAVVGEAKRNQYTYGNRGTRTTNTVEKVSSTAPFTIGAPVTTRYTYTDEAELCAEDNTGVGVACTTTSTGANVTGYSYDNAGRRTAVDRPTGAKDQTISYTARSKPETITTTDASTTATVTRSYDGFGYFNHETIASGTTTNQVDLVWNYADGGVPQIYDPSTGQFLSRDPANALTRSAYGYVGGNPLNMTDPSGLFGIPGTDWCVDIADDSCNSIAEQHPEVSQGVADFSGGVLNGLSFGTASNVGFVNDRVNFESGWAMGGHAVGGALLLPFAIEAAPAFFYVSTAAGVGNAGYTCYQSGVSAKCVVSASFAVANFYLPGMGAEFAAFRGLPSAFEMNSLAAWSWLLNLKGGVETSAVEQAGC